MTAHAVELHFTRRGPGIIGRCPEAEVEVGPFLSRLAAEEELVRAVTRKFGPDENRCFVFRATQDEPGAPEGA